MRLATVLACVLATAAGPALAETWHPFSRSRTTVFMADVDAIVVGPDVTSIPVAMAPREGAAGDYSHSVETYEFQCMEGQWRTAGLVEYGPDGAQQAAYPEEGAAWEPVTPDTLPAFAKDIACESVRADPPVWSSVKAFVDAGRG